MIADFGGLVVRFIADRIERMDPRKRLWLSHVFSGASVVVGILAVKAALVSSAAETAAGNTIRLIDFGTEFKAVAIAAPSAGIIIGSVLAWLSHRQSRPATLRDKVRSSLEAGLRASKLNPDRSRK